MIILQLNGGLGNQMFQYAFCRFLADKYHQKICIDFSKFKNSNRAYALDMFPLNPDLMLNIRDLPDFSHYQTLSLNEDGFRFNPDALSAFDDCDLENSLFLVSGYWQSPQYFQNIYSLILRDFRNTYPIDAAYDDLRKQILSSQAVMVHVRRGDYLWSGNLAKHGIVDNGYLQKGMKYYRDEIENVKFFIFSDDPQWCRQNISASHDIIFVDKDCDDGKTSFSLMRQCKYFLISNSTYSWWAAWLATHPQKKVICPQTWFRENNGDALDLIPPDWAKY